MDRKELKLKLDLLKINPNQYSLDGDLKSDAIILYQNYNKWEVYYFDERGGKNDEQAFNSERDACSYIYRVYKHNYPLSIKPSKAQILRG